MHRTLSYFCGGIGLLLASTGSYAQGGAPTSTTTLAPTFGSPSSVSSFLFDLPPPPPLTLFGTAPVPAPTLPPMQLPGFLAGFYFDGSADVLPSTSRNSTSGQIVHPVGGTAAVIDASQLAFGGNSGSGGDYRVGAGYDMIGVEWRWLGPFSWTSSSIDVPNAGNVQIGSFANFGATDLNGMSHSTFNQSREFNVRLRIAPWLTVFAGKRSFSLSDETDLNIRFPAFTAEYIFNSPWSAEGHQIGAEVRLFGPGTWWAPWPFFGDIDGRIGSYAVNATTNFHLYTSTGGDFPGGASYSQTGVRISEVGAAVGYRLTPNMEVRLGYRELHIPDVLFANDYAIAATANGSQDIIPTPRALNIQMVTAGARLLFGGGQP